MKKTLLFSIGVLFYNFSIAQGNWTWTEKAPLPIPTSNNGVASAKVGDTTFVYSFAGVTGKREYSDMHTKALKYNTVSDKWSIIPDLPESLGGIVALSANTIKNKIYILGGFHTYSNGTAVSSYEVRIFDPLTETYTQGARIPTSIDDHVSCVYKDSLLYVITGWSSDVAAPLIGMGNNVNLVQIYNPATDTWEVGTATPASNNYRAFGAAGCIFNDTIYYAGGATHETFSFPLTNLVRKGIINKNNPTQITWSIDTLNPGNKLYRAASLSIDSSIFWIGGSVIPYDYNGLSYTTNTPVLPRDTILEWNPSKRNFYRHGKTDFSVMDLRGIAQISKKQFIIAGGMLADTTVSNKTFLLEYILPLDTTVLPPDTTVLPPDTTILPPDTIVVLPPDTTVLPTDTTTLPTDTTTSIFNSIENKITIYPNPSNGVFRVSKNKLDKVIIYNLLGTKLFETYDDAIVLSNYKSGKYVIEVYNKNKIIHKESIVIY